MSNGFHLYFDAKTIAAGNATRRGLLEVPSPEENDTLYIRGENDKKWREHLTVKATSIGPWESKPEVAIISVQYKVLDDAYPKNANKILSKSYFINTEAVSDATHKEHKRTMITIGKLNSLIRGCGVELEKDDNDRVPYHKYFEKDTAALVGKTFWGVVRDYTYKNRDSELINDQEIDSFIKEDN